jgi:hypothetical protein
MDMLAAKANSFASHAGITTQDVIGYVQDICQWFPMNVVRIGWIYPEKY